MGLVFNPFTGTFDFTGSSGGGGGTISGTIAATQVAFGTAPDTIGGSDLFTFNATAGALTLTQAAQTSDALTLSVSGGTPVVLYPYSDGSFEIDINGAATNVYADVSGFWEFTGRVLTHGLFNALTDPSSAINYAGLTSNVTQSADATHDETAVSGSTAVTASTSGAIGGGVFYLTQSAGTTSSATGIGALLGVASLTGASVNSQGITGVNGTVTMAGTSSGVRAFAGYHLISMQDTAALSEAAYLNYMHFEALSGSPTVAHIYGPWIGALGGKSTGSSYPLWIDEQGVRRVKADNTFNSVYQAIEALYNPQFTKYTPDATNFERIVQQWESNVAVITTEAGGTGTLRAMRLGDANVSLQIGGYTTNGFVTTTSGNGTIAIDSTPYVSTASSFVPALMLMGG